MILLSSPTGSEDDEPIGISRRYNNDAPPFSRPRYRLTLALVAALLATSANAASPDVPTQAEQFYQQRFCAGMDTKIRLGTQQRADCISQTHVIEVDWHDEWREGFGRALTFSAATGLLPGLVVVCRSDEAYCRNTSRVVRETMSYHGIKGTLWDCLPVNRTLDECKRWDL